MANYSANKKTTELDILTTLASDDVVVVGDTSDSGKAKAISKTNLKVEMESGQVNATVTDTTPGVLDDKIEIVSTDSSVTVTKTVQNAGGDEKISYNLATIGGSGGGGGGGTKLSISTTQVVVASNTTVSAYVVSIPGGTISTNNGIFYRAVISTMDIDANNTYNIKYGSTTINSILRSFGSGTSKAVLEGYIYSAGTTTSQKGDAVLFNDTNSIIMDNAGTATENSAITLNLTLQIVAATGGGLTLESFVVQQITSTATSSKVCFPLPTTPLDSTSAVGDNALSVPTTMYVGLINVPTAIVANKLSIRSGGNVNTSGTVDITLYAEDGQSQLFSITTGTISAANTIYSTSLSAVSIPAGNYYIGINSNSTFNGEIAFFNMFNSSSFATSALRNGVTGEPLTEGTVTITSGTPPTTITPTTLTSGNNSIPVFRLDN